MYNNFSSKKTKKVISALLASALVVTSAPITANAATKKVVGVGKTVTYKAGATVKKITVKNKKVVKATKSKKNKKNVVLKGLKAGKTTVTIKTSKKTIKLNVCVGATKITKKTLKTTMTAGGKQTVSVTAAGGKGDTITFTSSKKSVLKVNKASAKASKKGIAKMSVAAVAEGTAKLTVASKNTGVKKAFTIKVVAATPAPATQPPTVATTPAVTGTATAVATTPAVQATATAAVPGATATPGTDVTATPGTDVTATPGADVTATPGADVTAAPSFDPVTAKEGTLTVTTNVSGASVKVVSNGATVASVTMDVLGKSVTTGTLTPGVYTVEVSKKGYDTEKRTVTIDGNQTLNVTLKEEVILGASAAVTNALVEYENTVLVNDNAIVTVTVKDKDGNLVPNKSVVFSVSNLYGQDGPSGGVEVKGQNVQTTDANGKVSFVVGLKNTTADSTDTGYRASGNFTAQVLDVTDGTNATATGCVGFAALKVSNVKVDTDATKFVKGKNATDTNSISETYSIKEDTTPDVQYVSTQQVSLKDSKERAVTFNVAPKIALPQMSTNTDKASEFVQPVNEKSGDYFTYADYSKIIPLKEDTSKLQYATLYFDNIQLSKYTEMTIASYDNLECSTTGSNHQIGETTVVKGELEQVNFGYQIPLTTGNVKAIKVTLKSAGQVQTNKNDGYSIREIKGIYNAASNTSAAQDVELSTATVNWEAVDPTMSNLVTYESATDVQAIRDLGVAADDGVKFTVQVPTYPQTGNAVIRGYDENNKLVSYYLVPTIKSTVAGNKNVNIINTSAKAYKATEKEATTYIKTGVESGKKSVTVNSEEVGVTSLKGTISIPGLGGEILDAANKYVYTSVQWNPVPTEEEATESNAFLALAGQNITVYAQLTDANGNPVSAADQPITYYFNKQNGSTGSVASEASDKEIDGKAVVKNTKTDINGRAELVLNSSEAAVLDDLTAKSGNYNVVFYIGKKTSKCADLYWVDANLSFQREVGATKEVTENDTKTVTVNKPTAGTPWEYAVKTVGNEFKYGATQQKPGTLSGCAITVDGIKVNTTFDDDNKGKYEVTGNGVVDGTSTAEYEDVIINSIDSKSVGSDVKFTVKIKDEDVTFDCVGEGNANLNAKMKLNVGWEAEGTAVSMITPIGTIIKGNTVDLYVKLTDASGHNPKADKQVKIKSGNTSDSFSSASGTTDSNGIVKFTLTKGTEKSSVITAYVDNVDQVASTTINWVEEGNDLGLVNAAVASDNEKQIVLTFNNNLTATSVKTGMFTLTAEEETAAGNKKTVTYEVANATASGKYVYLDLKSALAANEYTITYKDYEKDSVTYKLADEKGVTLPSPTEINFYSTKKASFDLALSNGDYTQNLTIKNIKSPIASVELSADDNGLTTADENADTVITNKFEAYKYLEKYAKVVSAGAVLTMDIDKGTDGTDATAKLVEASGTEYTVTVTDTDPAAPGSSRTFAGSKTANDLEFTIEGLERVEEDAKVTVFFLGSSETKTVKAAASTSLIQDGEYQVSGTTVTLTFDRDISVVEGKTLKDEITAKDSSGATSRVIASATATGKNLTIDITGLVDTDKIEIPAGIIENAFGKTNAAITIASVDLTKPKIASAKIGDTKAKLVLTFDEAIEATAATTKTNWTRADVNSGTANPTSVAISDDGKTVTLTFDTDLVNSDTVTANASNIVDIHGNVIDSDADVVTLPASVAVDAAGTIG